MNTDTNERILKLISQKGQAKPVDLVRVLGFTRAAIHRQLNKLRRRNLIEKVGTAPKVHYQIKGLGLEEQIATALKKDKNIVSAYILGSYNTGKTNLESDFDLAVVVEGNLSENHAYDLIKKIKFPRDLDLSVVNKKSSPLFLFQIVSTGRRIFERSFFEAIAFEDFTLHNYYDTAYLRRRNYQYLKQKFAYANQ